MTAWIAAGSALVVAVLSGSLTYLSARRSAILQGRLHRIDEQLGELYGPLYALTQASNVAWLAFRSLYGNDRRAFFVHGHESEVSQVELDAWKDWMRYVFAPINRKIYDLILNKAELLVDHEMPRCLILFCAHAAGYEVALARWERDDFSMLTSVINHPGEELMNYVSQSHAELRLRYDELARLSQPRRFGRRKKTSNKSSSRTG